MSELRDLTGRGPIGNFAGPRAFFKTTAGPGVYPSQTAYPTEGSRPTVYYARRLKNVTFPRQVGNQSLDFDTTEQFDFIFNLEPDKYIEQGAVVLCFRENGQWFTIDKVLQDEPCCYTEMKRKAPLRLLITHRRGAGASRVVVDSFECTMVWHKPTPTWLQTVRDFPGGPDDQCPDTGFNMFGTGGLWLSDEEKVWSETTRRMFPFILNDVADLPSSPDSVTPAPVRAFIHEIFGWAEQQIALCETANSGTTFRLQENILGQTSGECGFGMVRTDTHYDSTYMGGSGAPGTGGGFFYFFPEFVYHSFASKVGAWTEFTCDPVYGFGYYPRYIGTRSENGLIGRINPTTGLFEESNLDFLEYLLTEMP